MAKDGSLELHEGHGKGPEAMPDSGGWLRVPEWQNELIMISEVATHCHCHHEGLPKGHGGQRRQRWGPRGSDNRRWVPGTSGRSRRGDGPAPGPGGGARGGDVPKLWGRGY